MEQRYQILQKQKQIISQKQLQALHILSMDNVELDLFLQAEYLENPMLEHMESSLQPYGGAGEIRPSVEDDKWNRRGCEIEDLKTYLTQQLQIGKENPNTAKIKEYLIACVEDSGYFTMPLAEAAKKCGASVTEVECCLEELRLLEPVGVFSADLQECLLRQLEVLGIEDPQLQNIINCHLEDAAQGKISRISREQQISTAQVRKYLLLIGTLKPRPAMGFGGTATEYTVPDIVVRKDKKWEIELNDGWMGEYQISDYYLRLMKETTDTQLRDYFQDKARRVRFILQNVEQRRQTLLTITGQVLSQQQAYFERRENLKPMNMTEMAKAMGVHASTVSRAVKGKYIQHPGGTVLLKSLFSQGVSKIGDQTEVNAQAIKALIQSWISKENKKKPYSDQKLKDMLAKEGIHISRRVVAKYRDAIGIKGSFDRKE